MADLSKLLKDAPRGMKLYSPLFGEVTFGYVSAGNTIWVTSSNGKTMFMFTRNGKYCLNFKSADDIDESAECLLFPGKGQTWDGWKVPVKPQYKVHDCVVSNGQPAIIYELKTNYYLGKYLNGHDFCHKYTDEDKLHLWSIADAKDGDVLALNGKPFIYSHKYEKNYCYIDDCGQFRVNFSLVFEGNCVCPATEEERDLLFDKMKEVGYQWDAEKKELRKIIKPKFKLHDIIMRGSNLYGMRTIMHVNNEKMTYGLSHGKDIPFSEQDLWHLANSHYFINNFKPFQKVLVREEDDCPWRCDFYSHKEGAWFFTITDCYRQCIPFEGNENLVGTTKPCPQEYVNW